MLKKLESLKKVFCVLLIVLLGAAVFAQSDFDVTAVEPELLNQNEGLGSDTYGNPRVYDYAEVFSQDEEDSLETSLAEFRSKYDMDAVIVTTKSTDGKTTVEYADDFFDYNGFGVGEDHSGVLFLIDYEHREMYISTCGSTIDYLTDQRIERILDDVFEASADYMRACNFISSTSRFIEAGIPYGQSRIDTDSYDLEPLVLTYTPKKALIALLFGIVIGFIVCKSVSGVYKFKTATYSYPYDSKGKINYTVSEDTFISKNVTKRYIQTSSSSSGNHSSTHTSSSGRSHGGGGRSF